MRKLNLYASLGLVLSILGISLKIFNLFSNITQGLCITLGLTLILFGIIFQEYDILKFLNNKK